jgi:hypothetical protein
MDPRVIHPTKTTVIVLVAEAMQAGALLRARVPRGLSETSPNVTAVLVQVERSVPGNLTSLTDKRTAPLIQVALT